MLKADNLPPSCAIVMKSGSLNFLESSGPVQAALPFTVNLLSLNFDKMNHIQFTSENGSFTDMNIG